MQRLDIDLGFFRCLRLVIKDIRHAVEEVVLPLLDLVEMDVELRRQLARVSGKIVHWTFFYSLTLLSPFKAAKATFALNAGLWFRLGRLAMVAPSSRHAAGSGAENPPNSTVQISQDTSQNFNHSRFRDILPNLWHCSSQWWNALNSYVLKPQ